MTGTKERRKMSEKDKPNSQFTVVMYNDDVTPMDVVVMILYTVFNYSINNAVQLMLQIHNSNKRVVGIFPEKLAYAKRDKAVDFATKCGFPNFKVEVEEV